MNNQISLSARNLTKHFKQENNSTLEIFNNINLDIIEGSTTSIIGSSGSGKTSLLQILAGLDTPTSGRVLIDNEDIHALDSNSLCKVRNQKLGFIYQFHHLLPEFTALENILMPISISGTISPEHSEKAKYILSRLGLDKRMKHYPSQLSGGERQRVAIARATINSPKIIFADEPTGNLDNHTAHQVLDIFFELQQELKTSVIIVTHDMEIADKTCSKYRLHNCELLNI